MARVVVPGQCRLLGESKIASPVSSSPNSSQWVAIDLETTGLSSTRDAIIEIGAVRFDRDRTIDEFQTFVNPRRELPQFIRDLTGIAQKQVDAAPTFPMVADELQRFMDGATPVAHNAGFDLGFLRRNGMDIGTRHCDTFELAYLVRPSAKGYSLTQLTRQLSVHPGRSHRALDDARSARDVFLALLPELALLDPTLLSEFRRLSSESGWNIQGLLDAAEESGPFRLTSPSPSPIGGVDARELRNRLQRPPPIRPNEESRSIEINLVVDALSSGSAFSDAIANFEERPEQIDMSAAVADTVDRGGRLMVEAGTGVGKSLAYLLPAALYATVNGQRVVVSTNTINLQEQLVNKDLPMVKQALAAIDPAMAEEFRYSSLKGRANYLCFKRWEVARRASDSDEARARMIAKTTGWIASTQTGDRSELNIGPSNFASAWNALSAQRAFECPARAGGPCFLQAARSDAEASHVVVVNHSLLLSDLVSKGSAIPEYDVLIVDEAHHLEDVATDQLTYTFGQGDIDEMFSDLTTERGLLVRAQGAIDDSDISESDRVAAEDNLGRAQAVAPRLREEMRNLLRLVASVVAPTQDRKRSQYDTQVRILPAHRDAPEWESVVQVWDNVAILLSEMSGSLERIVEAIRHDMPDRGGVKDALLSDLTQVQIGLGGFSSNVSGMISEPSESRIYWVIFKRQTADVTLNSAPLEVGPDLREKLYDQKRAIVMTSATLSTDGSLEHAVERLGFDKSNQLLLGSPFNYSEAALLYAPAGVPHPNTPDFQHAVESAIVEAATAAHGRTMVLFTSHDALRNTARSIRPALGRHDIQVLSQGLDGPPPLLAEWFLEEPRSVLLGTSSFWQGVDFPGDALTVLIIVRLPFTVPSDPIFQARSEQYGSQAFAKYAIPQAILKFRQGFGRLIRSSTDRGIAIVMDSRITSSRYGQRFVDSLPKMTVTNGKRQGTTAVVKRWLEYKG